MKTQLESWQIPAYDPSRQKHWIGGIKENVLDFWQRRKPMVIIFLISHLLVLFLGFLVGWFFLVPAHPPLINEKKKALLTSGIQQDSAQAKALNAKSVEVEELKKKNQELEMERRAIKVLLTESVSTLRKTVDSHFPIPLNLDITSIIKLRKELEERKNRMLSIGLLKSNVGKELGAVLDTTITKLKDAESRVATLWIASRIGILANPCKTAFDSVRVSPLVFLEIQSKTIDGIQK